MVDIFSCSLKNDDELINKNKQSKNSDLNTINNQKFNRDVILILTDDSLLIFEEIEYDKLLFKLIFWSTIFSIIDMKINQKEKNLELRYFDDSTNSDLKLKFEIDNIVFFKEALIKRMKRLKIKAENQILIKGKFLEKRYTDKDINNMTIDELANNFINFKKLLKDKFISFYNINTFITITKKIIEYYSARNDPFFSYYLSDMQNILNNEEIKKIIKE